MDFNGGETRNETLTVGTSSVQVSANKNRPLMEFVYRNCSTGGQIISLTFSNVNTAVANQGIVLAAGQSVSDTSLFNHIVWSGTVNAISSAAGGTLSIYERV